MGRDMVRVRKEEPEREEQVGVRIDGDELTGELIGGCLYVHGCPGV